MAVNPLYIPLFNIEEVILDKDSGLPLAAGVVKFYRDSQRLTPKQVYQIAGTSPNYTFISVGSDLTLGLSGTFVDQDGDPFVPYAYPYDSEGELDLYYITVESEGGVDQFVRQAVPYVNTETIPPSERASTANELSNPQFVEVNFPSSGTTTISVTGSNTVTRVAPNWDLITSGTGTIELERIEPTGSSTPTNPPYTLRILASSGLGASVTLRQRLTHTPSIFRGGFASGSMIVAILSGGSSFVSMSYAPSTGSATEIIPSTSVPTDAAYHIIANNAAIPDQANTAASTGYVDINITLPTSRNIAISSIQAVGTSFSVNIPFDEETAGRQKDHLFHYYQPSILILPKKSLSVGWNFRGNPWQFNNGGATTISTTPLYTADQTIVVTSEVNSISVSRTSNPLGLFQISAAMGVTQGHIAMFQYIDSRSMAPYYGYKFSSLVRARLVTSSSTSIKIKFRAFFKNGLPGTLSTTDPISGWDTNGDPIFNVAYTAIIPENDPSYTLQNNYDADSGAPVCPAMTFNNMDLAAPLSGLNVLATIGIMVYTVGTLSNNPVDSIQFDQVSFVPNPFAMDNLALSFDEILRDCQYYYEKSYNMGDLPGTTNSAGISSVLIASNTGNLAGMERPFKVSKRTSPTVTFYSPVTGAANTVHDNVTASDVAVASIAGTGISSTGFPNLAAPVADRDTLVAQWVGDSRLGL